MFLTREKKKQKKKRIYGTCLSLKILIIYLSFFSYSSNLDRPCFIIHTVLFFIESIKRCKIIITRLMDLQHLTLKMILRIMIPISIICLFVALFLLVMDSCYWLHSPLLGLHYYFKANVNIVHEKKFGNSKTVLIYFFYNNSRSS